MNYSDKLGFELKNIIYRNILLVCIYYDRKYSVVFLFLKNDKSIVKFARKNFLVIILGKSLYYSFWKMDINKISPEELKINSKRYAQECTTDELLDALNLCGKDNKRKEVIIDILKVQQNIGWKENKESNDSEINLSNLLNKFHTDVDAYSLKHRLMEIWAKNPELSFKCGLLRSCTLLLEGKSLSEQENDVLEEFNIDVSDSVLLNRLKVELELNLNMVYSTKSNSLIDISSNKWMLDSLLWLQRVAKQISIMKYANGRLDGKKLIPWHCAFDDSPSTLKSHGEDVVQYDLWDEYIPCDNHASSLELLNKINTASVEELERMYLEKKVWDLEFWKDVVYEDDKNGYILHLKNILLIEFNDILDMYKRGDHFIVVKATYKGKEILNWKYINCWYVDVYSEKTKKIYRVLSI